MSLLIAAFLKDCILMAADSRSTWKHKDGTVTYQDGTKKLFILNDKVAISTCRNAHFNGQTVEWHMNKFIDLYRHEKINKIPDLLKEFFLKIKPDCNVAFFVAGYNDKNKPVGYSVYTQEKNVKIYTSSPVAHFKGETNFVSRAFST